MFALERETNRGASGVASFRFSDSSCDSRRACVRATLRCFSAVFGAKLAISAARRDKLFILCQVLRTHCPANPLSQPRSKVVLVWWVPCGAVCGVLSQTVGRGTSRDTAPACLLPCLLLLLLFLLLLLSSRGSPIGWHYLRPAGNISVSVRLAVWVSVCERECRLCVASAARQTQIKSASKVFAPRATLHRWVTSPLAPSLLSCIFNQPWWIRWMCKCFAAHE